MTRKKVKLAYIANDTERKASFKKRKKGLMKKVQELSILCGIDVFIIICNPFTNEPEVWPEDPEEVQRVLEKFRSMPEVEVGRKMVNQEGFIRERSRKIGEQLKKHQKENRQKEVTDFLYQCLAGDKVQKFSVVDMNDMGWVITQMMKEIVQKLELMRKQQAVSTPEFFTFDFPVEIAGAVEATGHIQEPLIVQGGLPEMNGMQGGYGGLMGWDDQAGFPYLFDNGGEGPSYNFPN